MYQYLAYGLGIHSDFKLFDLPGQTVKEEIIIKRGKLDNIETVEASPAPYLILQPQQALLSIDDVGRFQVYNGTRITIDPYSEADPWLVQRYIVGACMALLLYQRMQLVLHASAVNINGHGVVFLGASGAGKSSIAASFLANGHEIFADDVTSVVFSRNTPYLYPGFPYLKLSDQTPSLEALSEEKLEFSDHYENKSGYRVISTTVPSRVPLRCIYVIIPGEQIHIKSYDFQQSLIELVRYSIPPSMVKLDKTAHFKRCVEVVNHFSVFELSRPLSFLALQEIVTHVENHLFEIS